jgi:hypothetical protein
MGERSELFVLSVIARAILERHKGKAKHFGIEGEETIPKVLIAIEEAQRVLGARASMGTKLLDGGDGLVGEVRHAEPALLGHVGHGDRAAAGSAEHGHVPFPKLGNDALFEASPLTGIGYDDAGQLTEALRRRPYSIVVFDEVEKAHPELHNMLLQIMEEGHLSDAKGRTVDFKNTVVIMTSNVGAEFIKSQMSLGFATKKEAKAQKLDYETMKERVLAEDEEDLPPRVPQPRRRHRRVPPAHPYKEISHNQPASWPAAEYGSQRLWCIVL